MKGETDFREFELIKKNLEILSKLDLRVGYIGRDGEETHIDSMISVATLAAIHEYGGADIPQRSFIRSTMVDQQEKISNIYTEVCRAIIMDSIDPLIELEKAGSEISKLVAEKLDRASTWAEGLKPDTILAKNSAQVLKKSGQLKRNLGWAVVEGDSILSVGRAS